MSKLLLRSLPLALAMTFAGSLAPPPASAQNLSRLGCYNLWILRNQEYAQVGYCFRSARGKSEFGNAGCHLNESQARRAMGANKRRRVDRIKAVERRKGC